MKCLNSRKEWTKNTKYICRKSGFPPPRDKQWYLIGVLENPGRESKADLFLVLQELWVSLGKGERGWHDKAVFLTLLSPQFLLAESIMEVQSSRCLDCSLLNSPFCWFGAQSFIWSVFQGLRFPPCLVCVLVIEQAACNISTLRGTKSSETSRLQLPVRGDLVPPAYPWFPDDCGAPPTANEQCVFLAPPRCFIYSNYSIVSGTHS